MSAPKPSPDIHVLRPVPDPQGLPEHAAEARRRVIVQLLPFYTDVEKLLTVAEWIVYGPLPEEETS